MCMTVTDLRIAGKHLQAWGRRVIVSTKLRTSDTVPFGIAMRFEERRFGPNTPAYRDIQDIHVGFMARDRRLDYT